MHPRGLHRNFRFQLHLCAKPYASHPLVSSSDHRGHSWVASAARLAVPLTGLVWFSPPASFAADTSPRSHCTVCSPGTARSSPRCSASSRTKCSSTSPGPRLSTDSSTRRPARSRSYRGRMGRSDSTFTSTWSRWTGCTWPRALRGLAFTRCAETRKLGNSGNSGTARKLGNSGTLLV